MRVILLCAAALPFAAAPQPLGMIAGSRFAVNYKAVAGTATLFENDRVESRESPLRLHLTGGPRILLAPQASGIAHRDRFTLEKGQSEIHAGAGASAYRMDGGVVRLVLTAPDAAARMTVSASREVRVAVTSGAARAESATGVTIANMIAGQALNFAPHAGGSGAPWTLTGCLERGSSGISLRDETTRVQVRLEGSVPPAAKRVEVTGREVPGSSGRALRVDSAKALPGACP